MYNRTKWLIDELLNIIFRTLTFEKKKRIPIYSLNFE